MGYLVAILTVLFASIAISSLAYVGAENQHDFEDNLQYVPDEYDGYDSGDTTEDISMRGDDYTSHKVETSVAKGDKQEAIIILEQEIDTLRKGPMSKAMNLYQTAVNVRNSYKRNLGWFPTSEEKKRLANLDEEVRRQESSLSVVLDREKALTTRLKPLHGVISLYFAADQQRAIKSSIQTVSEIGYNNAWYSTLFSIGEVESFQDLIMMFIGQYVLVFIIFYPLAILYFALWTTPWNIYAYSSSWLDLPTGILAWLSSVAIMALPFVCLVVVGYMVLRVLAAREGEHRRQTAYRRGVGYSPSDRENTDSTRVY